MHKTSVNLKLKTRQDIIAILNARLADAIDLHTQIKLAHWNIRGPHFIGLHELFDKIAEATDGHADELAERIGQLGGNARATLQEVAKASSLPKANSELSETENVVTALVKAMAVFVNAVRNDIDTTDELGDKVTSDMLTGIAGQTDKNLWFVEAHLQ